jgi:hypothetical protein
MTDFADFPFNEYKLYIILHSKECRRMACLYNPINKKRKTISYARYLMSVKLKRELLKNEEVDHINDDKLDDRIENLQILSKSANVIKNNIKDKITYICPICGKNFIPTRNQTNRITPCCSRKCGGIKSHLS